MRAERLAAAECRRVRGDRLVRSQNASGADASAGSSGSSGSGGSGSSGSSDSGGSGSSDAGAGEAEASSAAPSVKGIVTAFRPNLLNLTERVPGAMVTLDTGSQQFSVPATVRCVRLQIRSHQARIA